MTKQDALLDTDEDVTLIADTLKELKTIISNESDSAECGDPINIHAIAEAVHYAGQIQLLAAAIVNRLNNINE